MSVLLFSAGTLQADELQGQLHWLMGMEYLQPSKVDERNDLLFAANTIRPLALNLELTRRFEDGLRAVVSADLLSEHRNNECTAHPAIGPDQRKVNRCKRELLAEASLIRQMGILTLGIGKMKINQAGIDGQLPDHLQIFPGPYQSYWLPFPTSQAVIEFGLQPCVLQITDDVTTRAESSGIFSNVRLQPAPILQCRGSFQHWTGQLQGAFYDLNHSWFTGLSLGSRSPYLNWYIDLIRDMRREKYLVDDQYLMPFQVYRNVTLAMEFLPEGNLSPIVKGHWFNVHQPEVVAAGINNRTNNRLGFDDNYLGISFGFKRREIFNFADLIAGIKYSSGKFFSEQGRTDKVDVSTQSIFVGLASSTDNAL